MWARFLFLPQNECKAADKTLEHHFLKEFKATESELKQQKVKSHLGQLCSQSFNLLTADTHPNVFPAKKTKKNKTISQNEYIFGQ